jgi:hypothetical protein
VVKDHHARFPAALVGLETIVQIVRQVLQRLLAELREGLRPAARSGKVVEASLPKCIGAGVLSLEDLWRLEPHLDRDVGRRTFRPQVQADLLHRTGREQLVHPVVDRHLVYEHQCPHHL